MALQDVPSQCWMSGSMNPPPLGTCDPTSQALVGEMAVTPVNCTSENASVSPATGAGTRVHDAPLKCSTDACARPMPCRGISWPKPTAHTSVADVADPATRNSSGAGCATKVGDALAISDDAVSSMGRSSMELQA